MPAQASKQTEVDARAAAVVLDLGRVHDRAHQRDAAAALEARRRRDAMRRGPRREWRARPRCARSRTWIGPCRADRRARSRCCRPRSRRGSRRRTRRSASPRNSSQVRSRPRSRTRPAGSLGTSMSMRCGTSSSRTISSAMSSVEPMRGATSSKIRSASGAAASDGADPMHRRQEIDAGVDAPAAALDEAVRVGHQRGARGQLDRGLADRRGLHVAERRRERVPEARHGSRVAVDEQRRRMARGGVGELLGVRIEREAERGRHLVLVDVAQHAPQQLGGRGVLVGVRAEGVAQLAHEHGRRDAVAGDVAHRHVHDAVGAAHRVVPVAADLESGAAGVVAADQLDALDLRAAAARAGCAEVAPRPRARARTPTCGRAPALPAPRTRRPAPARSRRADAYGRTAGRARRAGCRRGVTSGVA